MSHEGIELMREASTVDKLEEWFMKLNSNEQKMIENAICLNFVGMG
jgi:hypothetical protein